MSDLEDAFAGIWERRFFTNNGPLVVALDREMALRTGTRHAVCVVNPFLGLMFALRACNCSGEVILPALGAGSTADALRWAGAQIVFCDVNAGGALDAHIIQSALTPRTRGLAGVRLRAVPFHGAELEEVAVGARLTFIIDGRDAAGDDDGARPAGTFGDAEVFSLPALGTHDHAEGGCITTNDAELAKRLRTMRSFHAGETFAPVPLRANGKMSEAQAAVVQIALRSRDEAAASAAVQRAAYEAAFSDVPGVRVASGDGRAVVFILDPGSSAGRATDVARMLNAGGFTARTYGLPPAAFPVARDLAERFVIVTTAAADPERMATMWRAFVRGQV